MSSLLDHCMRCYTLNDRADCNVLIRMQVIQVAARSFGISDNLVHVSETATDRVPNASPTAASMSTDLYCMAALDACEQIKERLKPVAAKMPGLLICLHMLVPLCQLCKSSDGNMADTLHIAVVIIMMNSSDAERLQGWI